MSAFAFIAHIDAHLVLYGGLAAIPVFHLVRAFRARRFGAAGEHATTSLIHLLLALLE
jgi:hypothetical protein